MSLAMTTCGMLNWLDTASHRHVCFVLPRSQAFASLIGWRGPWIAVRLVCLPHNSFSWLSHVVDKLQ